MGGEPDPAPGVHRPGSIVSRPRADLYNFSLSEHIFTMKPLSFALSFVSLLPFLCLLLVLPAHAALPVAPPPQIEARAWLLVDSASGLPLAEKNPDAKVEPASLTKLMTAYIAFSAIKEGRLTLDQATARLGKGLEGRGLPHVSGPEKARQGG
jgi:hypothetical protein